MNKEIKEILDEINYVYDILCEGTREHQYMREIRDYITNLQQRIDKATNYYLKTLAKNGSMPDEAVEMFNLLEGNK